MSKNDGGPAFPVHYEIDSRREGMTLRDYFAAKAMEAMLRCVSDAGENDLAGASYDMADAMLAERAKTVKALLLLIVPACLLVML